MWNTTGNNFITNTITWAGDRKQFITSKIACGLGIGNINIMRAGGGGQETIILLQVKYYVGGGDRKQVYYK